MKIEKDGGSKAPLTSLCHHAICMTKDYQTFTLIELHHLTLQST